MLDAGARRHAIEEGAHASVGRFGEEFFGEVHEGAVNVVVRDGGCYSI
jgi:hypothetical protein